jgi:hypothetical protein
MRLIISSHYNENLDWINNVSESVKIYSKTNPTYNLVSGNQGQEIPCFLQAIIDNYYNFPDKILFVHGHKISEHQDYDIDFIINNLNWNLNDFFSINKRTWYQEVSITHHQELDGYNWIHDNWNLFYDTNLPLPTKLLFYSGAQFVINKELILQYDIEFYKKLYYWVQSTKIDSYITSRIFEYLWHYIFTRNPIEKQFSSILLQ